MTLTVPENRAPEASFLRRLSLAALPFVIFLATLAVYVPLVPWVLNHWTLTGDEPHYLIMTESLYRDGDLELSNNYTAASSVGLPLPADLDPHTSPGISGGAYPYHSIGLSALLLPAYAINGQRGVILFLAFLGALVATNIYLLSYEITGKRLASIFSWGALSFTPPLINYAFLIFPEMVGGLLTIWSVRKILSRVSTESWRWASIGLSIAFLPWLVTRFIPVALILFLLALFMLVRRKGQPSDWLSFLVPILASAFLYLAYNNNSYGSFSPFASFDSAGMDTGFFKFSPIRTINGALGWLLDQKEGLLIWAPIYILAIPGFVLLLRNRPKQTLMLVAIPAVLFLSLASNGFFVQWSVPVRYLVAGLPILGVFIAYAVGKARGWLFWSVGTALLLLSLATGGLLVTNPGLPYSFRSDSRGGLLMEYSALSGIDLSRLFPAFDGKPIIYDSTKLNHSVGDIITDGVDYPGTKDTLRTDVPATRLHRLAYTESDQSIRGDPELHSQGYLAVTPDRPFQVIPGGPYRAYFRLKTDGQAEIDAVVAVISVDTRDGRVLAKRDIHRGDFFEAGRYQDFALDFEKQTGDNIDLRVLFTSKGSLWARYIILAGNNPLAQWGLTLFWIALLVAFTLFVVRSVIESKETANTPPRLYAVAASLALKVGVILAALALLVVILAILLPYPLPPSNEYEAETLRNAVGNIVPDTTASGERALFANPLADKKGHLVYGAYQFLPSGAYEATFRLKAATDPSQRVKVATVEVVANAKDFLASKDIYSSDFSEIGQYQDFRLDFYSHQQILEFRVYFEAQAALWADSIRVVPQPMLLVRLRNR